VARTAEQGVLAERFNNAVHEIAKLGPLIAPDLEPIGDWIKVYVDGFEQLASTAEQKELASSFGEFAREITGPAYREAFQRPLVNELIDDMKMAMADGSSNGVPFAQLSREQKLEFLSLIIDWMDYINRGLIVSIGDENTCDGIGRIINRAIAGKPSEKWMGLADSLGELFGAIPNRESNQKVKSADKEKDLGLER
jgi:hypothetical protein